jgi:hypothetical protein
MSFSFFVLPSVPIQPSLSYLGRVSGQTEQLYFYGPLPVCVELVKEWLDTEGTGHRLLISAQQMHERYQAFSRGDLRTGMDENNASMRRVHISEYRRLTDNLPLLLQKMDGIILKIQEVLGAERDKLRKKPWGEDFPTTAAIAERATFICEGVELGTTLHGMLAKEMYRKKLLAAKLLTVNDQETTDALALLTKAWLSGDEIGYIDEQFGAAPSNHILDLIVLTLICTKPSVNFRPVTPFIFNSANVRRSCRDRYSHRE